MRFAVLVLVLTASTGSIFDYLWQLSRPDLEARTRACLATFSSGPLAKLIAQLSGGASARAVASAACVRPDGPALTAWAGIGIGVLAAMTLVLYLLIPVWIIKVGWPGSGPLTELDMTCYPQLDRYLRERAQNLGLRRLPSVYVNWAGTRYEEARAFGYHWQPSIRLNGGLLKDLTAELVCPTGHDQTGKQQTRATDVLLHELAHLRNKDNLPTYLTLAAWRAFAILIPAAYVVIMAVSGVRPSNPGPRILFTAAILILLVVLSTRAVLRARELHADATAAHVKRICAAREVPPEPPLAGEVPPTTLISPPRWRRALSYHPSQEQRAAVLQCPELLYRPDPLAMASAGAAIAIIAAELTPAVFSALLKPLFRPGSPFLTLTGIHPLVLILLTFGPAALLTSFLVTGLASASARQHERLASAPAARVPRSSLIWLALPTAGGMLTGIPLSFDYVIAGTWGVFDTTLARNLIVAAIAAAVLVIILLVIFGWSRESAAVWFTTAPRWPKLTQAAMLLAGTLGAVPAILAWTVISGLPVAVQLQLGITPGQRQFLATWPAAAAVSSHLTALGAFDIVPGGALLLALPCLFVAARSLHMATPANGREQARVPVGTVLTTGLFMAGIAVAAGLALVLALRTDIGAAALTRSGGYGLLYLNRFTELCIAVCAAIGATWVSRRARHTGLTSGILAALVTATAAAVFVPKLLFLGELGWGYRHVNPTAYPTLFGIAGNMTPGKAVAAALVLMTTCGLISRLATRNRARSTTPTAAAGSDRPARTQPALSGWVATLPRLATTLGFTALLTGMTFAAYYYFTRGFS